VRLVRTAWALKRELNNFLRDLGSSELEVAQRLILEGVRGVPNHTDDCAVAAYLHAVLGPDEQVESVMVTGRFVVVYRRRRRAILVPLPEPVRAFIRGFDKGHYPTLIRISQVKSASEIAETTYPSSGLKDLTELPPPSNPSSGKVSPEGSEVARGPMPSTWGLGSDPKGQVE